MTALSLPLSDVATAPYSPARLAKMDRANRIIRLMFNARRKGVTLTASEAGDIVDAAIDQPNLPTKATISKPAPTPVHAFIVNANKPAANESNIQGNVVAQLVTKARNAASQALLKLSNWLRVGGRS